MKKFKISLAVIASLICGALVISAYTKPVVEKKRFADSWFRFDGSAGQEYDPTKYTKLLSAPSNPSNTNPLDVAYIFVVDAEIYTSGPNTGKPMVDDADAGGNTVRIDEAIAHVLATPADDGQSLTGSPVFSNDLVYLQ